jgi:hypothetical protein
MKPMYLCGSLLYVLLKCCSMLDQFEKARTSDGVLRHTTCLPTAVERTPGRGYDDESTTSGVPLGRNRHATAHGHEDESPTAQPAPRPPLVPAPCHKLTARMKTIGNHFYFHIFFKQNRYNIVGNEYDTDIPVISKTIVIDQKIHR